MYRFLAVGATVLSLFSAVTGQDSEFTTCKDDFLDWYTDKTGENPCSTYQRLRQICEPNFRVGRLTIRLESDRATPPDTCGPRPSDCCYNSVAFTLAMLCLNCQQHPTEKDHTFWEVRAGGYDRFLGGGVNKAVNRSLPASVQPAVCASEPQIRIPDAVYNSYWPDGAWFYGFTKDQTESQFSSKGNGSFSRCPQQGPGSTPLTSGTPQSTNAGKSTSTGAIAGGVVGGVVGLLGIAAAVFFLLRRRRQKSEPRYSEDPINYPTVKPLLAGDPYLPPPPTTAHTDDLTRSGSVYSTTTTSQYPQPVVLSPPTETSSSRPYVSEKQRLALSNPTPTTADPSSSPNPDAGPLYATDAGSAILPPQYDANWASSGPSDSATRNAKA